MSSRKSVLLVGGGGQGPPSDGPPLPAALKATQSDSTNLKRALDAMIHRAAELDTDVRVMQLQDTSNEQQLLWADAVRAALEERSWDGFIIGNGIRGTPSLTMLFEKLVNAARVVAPGIPMGFNTHPMDVLDTIRRMFPEQG